jgi:hypothetical protein
MMTREKRLSELKRKFDASLSKTARSAGVPEWLTPSESDIGDAAAKRSMECGIRKSATLRGYSRWPNEAFADDHPKGLRGGFARGEGNSGNV